MNKITKPIINQKKFKKFIRNKNENKNFCALGIGFLALRIPKTLQHPAPKIMKRA